MTWCKAGRDLTDNVWRLRTLLSNAVDRLLRSESLVKMVLPILQRPSPTLIEPGLYLGTIAHAESREIMAKLNIKHTLSVTSARHRPTIPAGINNKWICLKDRQCEKIITYFPDACDFIEKALARQDEIKGNSDLEVQHLQQQPPAVLIHCIMGASRSVTLVIAYLMWKHKITLQEACNFIGSKCFIYPNSGFYMQLRIWEKSVLSGADMGSGVREIII